MTENRNVTTDLDFLGMCANLSDIHRLVRHISNERNETVAEHTWHTIMCAMILVPEELDLLRIIKMIAIHDLHEILAGDIDWFAPQADKGNHHKKEEVAAKNMFANYPELHALWIEFETLASEEARFAKCCDMLQPFIMECVGKHTPRLSREQYMYWLNKFKELAPENIFQAVEGDIERILERCVT